MSWAIGAAGWDHHCGDVWRQAVQVAEGRDICDVVGPSPRSRREWRVMMARNNARSLHDLVCLLHGDALPVRMARRGDLVMFGRGALGVCRGELVEFYGGALVPLAACACAWHLQED